MEITNTKDLTNLIINHSTRKQIQNVILQHPLNKVLIFSGVAGTGKEFASRVLAKEFKEFNGFNLISVTDLLSASGLVTNHHVDKIVHKNLGKVLLINDLNCIYPNDYIGEEILYSALHELVKDYRKNLGKILIIMATPPQYTAKLKKILIHDNSSFQTISFPSFSVNQLSSLADYKLRKCHHTGYHNQLKHDLKTVIPLNYLKDNGRSIMSLIDDINTVHDEELLSHLSDVSLSDIKHLTTDDINDGVYKFLVNSSHYVKTKDVNTMDDFQRRLNKMLIKDPLIVMKDDVREQLNKDLYDVPVNLLIQSSSMNKLFNCLISTHNFRLTNSSYKNVNLTKADVRKGIKNFIQYF